MTNSEATVTILRARQDEALKMLKKFKRKAARYNVSFSYSLGEPRKEKRTEQTEDMWYPNGVRTYWVDVVDVTITGTKPVVGDYEFLASIEFANEAGNFVDCVPGVELPAEYRTTDNRCEHCHASRQRKHVFIVRSRETGELMQVGRTCLRDFLGIDDPKWILERFRFFRRLREWGDEESFRGFSGSYWADELSRILGIALASVRIWGWVSVGQSRADESLTPTVGRYWLHDMHKPSKWEAEQQQRLRAEVREEDYATAQEIIKWVRETEPSGDYMWNLQIAFHDDVIADARRLGLVVSAVSAWHRHQEIELKRARRDEENAVSRHQGEVGERLRGLHVRLEMRRGMGDNGYGWTELLKMRDEKGNLYTWFTGAAPSVDVGEDLVIDGTVGAHKDFNGVQETQLTRVRVAA